MRGQRGERVDLSGVCRTWQDSNGHRLTLSHAVAIPVEDRDVHGNDVILHAVSTGCTCQFIAHDGPREAPATLKDLREGDMFGFEPYPRSVSDLALFVQPLLAAEPALWQRVEDAIQKWAEIGSSLDIDTDVDIDLGADAPVRVHTALHVLANNLPADLPRTLTGLPILRTMRQLGHTDPVLVSAAILDGTTVGEAADIACDLPESERLAYIGGVDLLVQLAR